MIHFQEPIIQKIQPDQSFSNEIELSVLREDLLHPFLSGNKWRKLKYNIEDFKHSDKKAIVTFGGKFSNHLVATAAACKLFNIPIIGILRGDENVSNPNLLFLQECGMKLYPISREEYRERHNILFLKNLSEQIVKKFSELNCTSADLFIIPEGGSNPAGVKGCREIMNNIPQETTHICVACGTGSTIAGIAGNILSHQIAVGISVLKAENFMSNSILKHGASLEQIKIFFDYHFGGYAKTKPELLEFCDDYSKRWNLPIEPVYTGKLFFGIMDLIKKNYFPVGSKIVAIHTGGIFDFEKALTNKNLEPNL